MNIGIYLCNCGGSINNIDWNEILSFLNKNIDSKNDFCVYHKNFCSQQGKAWIKEVYNEKKPDSIVFGGCSPKIAGSLFSDVLKELDISPYNVVGANLREHVGWVTSDKHLATEKAKAILLGSYNKAKLDSQVVPHNVSISNTAVIIGAGPAGIQAAQILANKNHEVHLIDRNPYIGGNPTKLGSFFPSGDCAACQLSEGVKGVHQSNTRRCYYRSGFDTNPDIDIYLRSEVEEINGALGNYSVQIKTKPTYVLMDKCVNCGLCAQVCPVEKPNEHNLGLSMRKAIYLPNLTTLTTKYVINRDECQEGCIECMKTCPVNAIDLNMQEMTTSITVGGIILATGFREYDPESIEEYRYGQKDFENVITQSELARFLDITGPTSGLLKKKNGENVSSLVIINCVGSRSPKYNSWCSNICCMIGIKHAIAIKEKQPEIDVTMCYIDIRAVGPNYEEYYTTARELGVKFIRGRPSDVESDGQFLYVNTEDSQSDKALSIKADMIGLSMAMMPSQGIEEIVEKLHIDVDDTGYFKELYSKLRITETKQPGIFIAGAAIAPSDLPTTITRAGYAANQLDSLLEKTSIEKRFPIAEIDKEKCTLCKICIAACHYDAIGEYPAISTGIEIKVDPIKCLGCGQCVASCPAFAIDVNHYRNDQIHNQLKGLLYDAKSNLEPVLLVFACWECAYAATDFVGQMSLTQKDMHYPHNVRILPIQCTANLSTKMVQESFSLGADGIFVLGCPEDKCHYETGSSSSSTRIQLLQSLLEFSGIDSKRLQKETIYTANSDKFVTVTRKMVKMLKELGKLQR
ncbi:MAG: hydrogenase iron-sulfur subunit [Candidatus Hodarchaeales archaeon]|jgi:heterodisulfide reductase subunit A